MASTKVPIEREAKLLRSSVKARVEAAQAALELASLTVMFPEVRAAVNMARTELHMAMSYLHNHGRKGSHRVTSK